MPCLKHHVYDSFDIADGDYEKVWREHCQDTILLSKYADAMHHLAKDIWTKNPETRIDWCRKTCLEYFQGGGLQKFMEKRERKARFVVLSKTACPLLTRISDNKYIDETLVQAKDLNFMGTGIEGDVNVTPIVTTSESCPRDIGTSVPDVNDQMTTQLLVEMDASPQKPSSQAEVISSSQDSALMAAKHAVYAKYEEQRYNTM